MSVECRLCGNISPAKIQLSDKIKGILGIKNFFDKFMILFSCFKDFYLLKSLSNIFAESI